MCKGKETAGETDHLHYPAALRAAARLLGYGDRREMGILLAACTAIGLESFGHSNAGFLVQAGSCPADDARAAQRLVVAYAAAMTERLKGYIKEDMGALRDLPI